MEGILGEKIGNDQSDEAANKGVRQHHEGPMELSEWLGRRQKGYVSIVKEIRSMIIGVLKEQGDMRKEGEKG